MNEKLHWRHESDLHVVFFGHPKECEHVGLIRRMDSGWKWEIKERCGRFDLVKNTYVPSLMRTGFCKKLECAMRMAIDYIDNIYTQFEKMSA